MGQISPIFLPVDNKHLVLVELVLEQFPRSPTATVKISYYRVLWFAGGAKNTLVTAPLSGRSVHPIVSRLWHCLDSRPFRPSEEESEGSGD